MTAGLGAVTRTTPTPDRLRILLDTLAAPKSMKFFKTNFASVKLAATDIEWTSGSGPVVSGPAEDLALLLGGRGQASGAIKNLTGEGVALLNR
jgi:MDMPI C-terminal domain